MRTHLVRRPIPGHTYVRLGSVASALKAVAPKVVGGTPYLLHGTLAQVRETLLRRRDQLGISYYVWSARLAEPMAPVVEALAGR